MPIVTLISAMALNRVIGINNTLPWHLPADFTHFKSKTMGKPIVMGRSTYESIGRPLPKRQNIVLTRDTLFSAEGCDCVHSLEEAIATAGEVEEIVIIGGEQIYRQFLPLADRLELTEVQCEPEGDAHFPEFDDGSWQLSQVEAIPADEKNSHAMRFLSYEKRRD